METNTLSDRDKLDVLFKTELLGGRKPSHLLAMNHTVTRATQNEALLRKIAVFGIGKSPPLDSLLIIVYWKKPPVGFVVDYRLFFFIDYRLFFIDYLLFSIDFLLFLHGRGILRKVL
jgi:hypothetical protein